MQSLQWYLSESRWDWAEINQRRLDLVLANPALKPHQQGVLVIDETGDRKEGHKTAHVGRQYLANLGKIDNGVVSVTSLWADERVYYPLEVEPYTPGHWFEGGKANLGFRTKLRIGVELVQQALDKQVAFRAVVADSFYGEDRGFRDGLDRLGVGYVLALKPSHSWWHYVGEIGSLEEYARAQPWQGPERAGSWVPITRSFRDGHQESWWALEVIVTNAYGPDYPLRVVVATTDPTQLSALNTWYLITNLPAPNTPQAAVSPLPAADLAELVRLYALRSWVEQSYKQVKHTLGWAQYQVRSDQAIRRHWILVFCAFTFCWWQAAQSLSVTSRPADFPPQPIKASPSSPKKTTTPTLAHLAVSASPSSGLARTVRHAQPLLESLFASAPAPCSPTARGLALSR